MVKKVLKAVAILLAAILVLAAGYVAYVFISYHRLPDMDGEAEPLGRTARAGEAYTHRLLEPGLRGLQRRLRLLHGRRHRVLGVLQGRGV